MSLNKKTETRLEEFAEAITQAARAAHGREDLSWRAAGDLYLAYCPLPGPDSDPHRCTGEGQVLLYRKGETLLAQCDKCIGGKATYADTEEWEETRIEYTAAVLDAIGWDAEALVFAPPEERHREVRRHLFRDRDGKHLVEHVKKLKPNGVPYWAWHITPCSADGTPTDKGRWLSKKNGYTSAAFLKQNYAECRLLYLALKWYQQDVVEAELSSYASLAICEGERDCETFNELMRAAGADLRASCLAYNKPGTLASHHKPLIKGRRIVIIADADSAGEDRALNLAGLVWDDAERVTIIRGSQLGLKGTPDDKDLTDWAARHGTPKEAGGKLIEILARAPAELLRPAGRRDDLRGYSDEGLTLSLGYALEEDWRYVATWNRWLHWTREVWQQDDVLLHMTKTREHLRGLADQVEDEGLKQHIQTKTMVANTLSLVRSVPQIAATAEQWDQDPMLLATLRGTIDLTTGNWLWAKREHYLTKQAAAVPCGIIQPERWLQFLWRVTGGDGELMRYLQRLAGYCLTGRTDEHVLPFLHGDGGNGKGVFAETLLGVMGGYAGTIGTEMLMERKFEQHPTEIARLRGLRLALGSEVEEGAAWAEARIKKLTGGDTLIGRFMRADFFEFKPTFKLLIFGNHRPTLRNVDAAIRRRLHLVPFTVKISEDEKDTQLKEKLRAEWPGILDWAICGCLAWQQMGLAPPAKVSAATSQYLEEEDDLAQWLADEIVKDPRHSIPVKQLYGHWTSWANGRGMNARSLKWFSPAMEARGWVKGKRRTGMVFEGLQLKSVFSEPQGLHVVNDAD